MVRLKVKTRKKEIIAATLFQFQYGAIKRILKLTTATSQEVFQFQYGAIKRQPRN